eukprot:TRINITY_DN1201_c0_g1_i3.p2 TRINITY_DN1201_c0_g1~~TRINITY_DN1201_c0_g1_i3.p2  ORF type:complete len:514 (-),score=134.55 TRINITY_DN1201_c0_g1_i3:2698-4239(-)
MGGSHSSETNNNDGTSQQQQQQLHHHVRTGLFGGAFGGGACGLFTSSLPLETTELHDLLISACRTGDFQVVQEIAMRHIVPPTAANASTTHENTSFADQSGKGRSSSQPPSLLNQPSRLPEDKGDTPLHICIRFQQDECVEVLLEAGVDVLSRNNDSQTPLHLAASAVDAGNERRKFVKLLLAEPILDYDDLDSSNNSSNNSQSNASPEEDEMVKRRKKKLQMMQMIVPRSTAKEQLAAQDASGNTALHLAVLHSKTKLFDYMIRFHPDLNIKNYDGYNVPSLIASLSTPSLRAFVNNNNNNSNNTCDVASEHNAIGQAPSAHMSAIDALYHMANSIFHNAATETFNGIRLESTNNEGYTALHLALRNEDLYLSSLLLAGGADVNATTKRGETALHVACASGNAVSVLQILKPKKKEESEKLGEVIIDARDIDGNTPLHLLLKSLSSSEEQETKNADHDVLDCVKFLIKQSPSLLLQHNLAHRSPHDLLRDNNSISDSIKREITTSFGSLRSF